MNKPVIEKRVMGKDRNVFKTGEVFDGIDRWSSMAMLKEESYARDLE